MVLLGSRYLGLEQETQHSFPSVWEQEFKAFPLGNMPEREFPVISTPPPKKKNLQKKKYLEWLCSL